MRREAQSPVCHTYRLPVAFRIAKTLAPGLYFIRVEGSHYSEGAYNLSVDVSSW